MISPYNLKTGSYYRVEFGKNGRIANWYTVQAVDSSHVIVITKNGSRNGGSGMITTADNIYEINESYARSGKMDPKHNEEASILLIDD